MRVIIQNTEYYNFQFSDDSVWQSYQIKTKNSDDVLYGYVKKGSGPHLELQAKLNEVKKASMRVEISYPSRNKQPYQVLINSILDNGWVFRR